MVMIANKEAAVVEKDRPAIYLPSIDGLRAFAVIAVIICHFNEKLLPSGYLGVDIFFVISGFVITSSLAKRKDNTARDLFRGFYIRRFKRLAPALLLCIVFTSIFISFFNPQPAAHLKTGIAAILGLSNIELYFNAVDYWGESAKLNPFTHTWSLGVEEQFYLLFPALVWVAVSGQWNVGRRKSLFWIIFALSVISLTGFVYVNGVNQSAAYFLTPFRFWELGTGAMLFLFLEDSNFNIKNVLQKISPLAVIAALVSVLLLPLEFSLHATIAVVILTALLIASLRTENSGHFLLSHPIMVYVGTISYSLYLWHWSVLIIGRWTIGIHWWSVPLLLSLILMLAAGSYHFVERPLRYSKWRSRNGNVIGGWVGASMGVTLLLFLLLTSPANMLYLGGSDNLDKSRLLNISNNVRCGSMSLSPSENNHVIRVIGNSHSLHILQMLNQIADKCGLEIIHEEYPDFIVFPSGDGKDIRRLEEVFQTLNQGDILILSSRNRNLYLIPYMNGTGEKWIDNSYEKKMHQIGLGTWLSELDSVIVKAREKGVNVVLFLPNVEFDEKVFPYDSICIDEWFRTPPRGCNPQVSRDYLDSRFPAKFYQSVKMRAKVNSNFYTFDPLPIYCGEKKQCLRIVNGMNAFRDTHHLTGEGSLLMLNAFNSFLITNQLIK